jgi:phenylacetate-CoA ligase
VQRYVEIQNVIRPYVKTIYDRAVEVLPALVMQGRYFDSLRHLGMPELRDEAGETVQSLQRQLLARTLVNALKNVPFYRQQVDIEPASIRPSNALEALQQFPLVEKRDIMSDPARFVSTRFSGPSLIYSTSGGSTGRGIALWKRLADHQAEQAFIHDMWSRYGYSRSSRVLRIGADCIVPVAEPPCRMQHRRLMVCPRHLNEKWLPEIVERIDAHQPEFIHAYASCVEVLAGYLRARGRRLEVKAVFLASEEVTKQQLEFFREVFEAPICFHYGASERVLLAYGCYDGSDLRYHLDPLYGFAENVRDDYGYELVGTGFWNDAMPLVRYRTQDYGKIVERLVKCAHCERTLKTVVQLDGRMQNYLTTKQGTKFPGLSVWVDKFIWEHVSTFQFVQNRPGAIELHVCPRRDLSPEIEAKILDAQRRRLSEWFEPITLVKVPELELTKAGKRRLVVVNNG